jgi:hypothetical protein
MYGLSLRPAKSMQLWETAKLKIYKFPQHPAQFYRWTCEFTLNTTTIVQGARILTGKPDKIKRTERNYPRARARHLI